MYVMRTFLVILMLAIGFSGFSAAAHAFGKDPCDKMSINNVVIIDHTECADHQADQDQKDGADKTAKGQCLDCTHHCASHAYGISDYAIKAPPAQENDYTVMVDRLTGDYFASLLRPPKTLV